MAQKWRSRGAGQGPRKPPPLDAAALERLGLRYVERYATTRAKLSEYLTRKLRERGWEGAVEPPVHALAERFAELGYVNDGEFATSRAAALGRRGFGPRRVAASLHQAGIAPEDAEAAHILAREAAWGSALDFARRKRIGPFAAMVPDRPAREKAMAAMARAGHDFATARRIVMADPGCVPEEDDA